MDSSVHFLRVSQRKNPKRGTEVQEYQVHCVKSTQETLMTLEHSTEGDPSNVAGTISSGFERTGHLVSSITNLLLKDWIDTLLNEQDTLYLD